MYTLKCMKCTNLVCRVRCIFTCTRLGNRQINTGEHFLDPRIFPHALFYLSSGNQCSFFTLKFVLPVVERHVNGLSQ